ncbi:DUF1028 domain-containing protein [Skermanella pratensis]|uniref:DUF1028 domain-containing protein n=1 Tax=Skermanella pratensis TaxID=2233999 RepID=UPI0013016E8B|nr:DUF1028 domain-containing protein [Skermanella pratensis]
MTFSIVARCPRTCEVGIAAVTGMPGVGKLLTHAAPGAGAVATQGWINPYLGLDGLALLRGGRHDARQALDAIIAKDEDRDYRQVAMIDPAGKTAVWTGPECADHAGSVEGEGFSVQGNLLTGPDTLRACAEAFEAHHDADLAVRLLHGLEAGEQAGGDRRGSQSATIYVFATEEYPLWDIRVDFHREPLKELRKVFDRFAAELVPQIRDMPRRDNSHGRQSHRGYDGLS